MFVAYSNVIGWVKDNQEMQEAEALAGFTDASRDRIMRMLAEYEDFKLSFGYSDEDEPGEHCADFAPLRYHPRALDYGAWMAKAPTMDAAIAGAEAAFHNLMAMYTTEG